MKLIGIVFISLSIVWMASATENSNQQPCIDKCGDDFDEVVCATNGSEQRQFSGRCRLRQHFECYGESEFWLLVRGKVLIEFFCRVRRDRLIEMPTKLMLS